jgi:hypothetical protein
MKKEISAGYVIGECFPRSWGYKNFSVNEGDLLKDHHSDNSRTVYRATRSCSVIDSPWEAFLRGDLVFLGREYGSYCELPCPMIKSIFPITEFSCPICGTKLRYGGNATMVH